MAARRQPSPPADSLSVLSAQRAAEARVDLAQRLKSGWLWKQGDWTRAWHRRAFVLLPDRLQYWEDMGVQSQAPKAVFALASITREDPNPELRDDGAGGRTTKREKDFHIGFRKLLAKIDPTREVVDETNAFVLWLGERELVLCAESSREKGEWVHAIAKARADLIARRAEKAEKGRLLLHASVAAGGESAGARPRCAVEANAALPRLSRVVSAATDASVAAAASAAFSPDPSVGTMSPAATSSPLHGVAATGRSRPTSASPARPLSATPPPPVHAASGGAGGRSSLTTSRSRWPTSAARVGVGSPTARTRAASAVATPVDVAALRSEGIEVQHQLKRCQRQLDRWKRRSELDSVEARRDILAGLKDCGTALKSFTEQLTSASTAAETRRRRSTVTDPGTRGRSDTGTRTRSPRSRSPRGRRRSRSRSPEAWGDAEADLSAALAGSDADAGGDREAEEARAEALAIRKIQSDAAHLRDVWQRLSEDVQREFISRGKPLKSGAPVSRGARRAAAAAAAVSSPRGSGAGSPRARSPRVSAMRSSADVPERAPAHRTPLDARGRPVTTEERRAAEEAAAAERQAEAQLRLQQRMERGDYVAEGEIEVQAALIAEREEDIAAIARDAQEIKGLFDDVNALVLQQQEGIDAIEGNVSNARDYTATGVKDLERADELHAAATPECTVQ